MQWMCAYRISLLNPIKRVLNKDEHREDKVGTKPDQRMSAHERVSLFIIVSPLNRNSLTDDLQLVLDCIQSINSTQLANSPYKDVPYNAAKYVIEFRSFVNPKNHEISIDILKSTLQFALKYDQTKELRLLIDPDRQYYRYHSQIEFDDQNFTQTKVSKEQAEFCMSLEEDILVDALKQDQKTQVIAWSRARIIKANERSIWVKWLGDDTKRKITRLSNDIAKFKSKVPDEEWDWRFQLKELDVIDCPDDNIWYNSTIMAKEVSGVVDGVENVEYRVGFRHYHDDGPQTDAKLGKRFFGWSSQYDEELNATNPRIQKINTFAKAFCKYASMSYAEETIKDSNDFLYTTKFAVPRFNTRSQRKSQVMLDLIELFGKLGGFDFYYERINDTQNWCSVDQVAGYMVVLGSMHEMLHRQFCLDYVPKLWAAVQNNLLQTPDSNLRNFSSQKINEILQGMGYLLKRVYSLKEKTEMIDKVDMQIAIMCFNSDFLERKLQGLKAIQELIKKTKEYQNTMSNSDIKFLTVQILIEWINENKIFERLYSGTNNHIIQRSAEFFKFMLEEKLLSLEHIGMVWKGVSETENKLAIYKLLKETNSSLEKEHLDFLIDKVLEKSALELSKEDVELLGDLTRYNYRHREEFCTKFANYYWKLLLSGEGNKEQLIQYYIEQVTSYELRPHRQEQLNKICESVIEGVQVDTALQVMIKFIEKLEIIALSWDNFTRNVALSELEQKYHILQQVTKNLEEKKLEEIRMIIEFIQFFYANITNTELKLNFETIAQLWDKLVCQGQSQEEKNLIYKWVSSLTQGQQTQLSNIVEIDNLKLFFEQKMSHQDLSDITKEGFNCYKAVFYTINVQNGNLKDTGDKDKNCPLTEDINNFYGFDVIWSIILESNSSEVAQLAIEFVHSLFLSRDNQLNFVFQQTFKYSKEYSKLSRVLQVLENIIDHSEINGAGNLKALNALSAGEVITIPVIIDFNNLYVKKIHVNLNDNQSIIELRLAISKQIKVSWDGIALKSNKREIPFTSNGRMIRDLRLKKDEQLTAYRQQTAEIPEVDLLDGEFKMTQDAKFVFEEIFQEYSTEAKMNKEQCAKFVTNCTGNPCTQEDVNITRTFEEYDKDKDGLLQQSDFIDFYTEAAKTKKQTVWQNLHNLNYRNDLLRGDRVPLPTINSNLLPRGVIVKNQDWLQMLFDLLDSPAQEKAWCLLRRLPPSPSFFKKMLQFEGLDDDNTDWDRVLGKNFRLLYSLHILEFLLDRHEKEAFLALSQTSGMQEDEETVIRLRDQWNSKFLKLKGYDTLFNYFKNYQQVLSLDLNEKEILSIILRIFCSGFDLSYEIIGHQMSFEEIKKKLLECSGQQQMENQESIVEKLEIEKIKSMVQDLISQELETEDRAIIEYGLIIIIEILSQNKNIQLDEYKQLLLSGLYSDNEYLKYLFGRGILFYALFSKQQKNNSEILNWVLQELTQQIREEKQYLELLTVLLDEDYVNLLNFSNQVIDKILNFNNPNDQILVQLLKLLNKCNRQDIDQLIFSKCLFKLDDSIEEIICKSSESRKEAFNLIKQPQEQFLYIISNKIPQIKKWNYVPNNDMRSQYGYVGIRNLGYICYMNAMLQQFYMTETFRYGILMADDEQEPFYNKTKDEVMVDDNILHQFQKMFAYLEMSDRVDYNPYDFCFAFKDFSGEPVNVLVQQDAQEFLNMILDKLENGIKQTPLRHILDGVYGGKTQTLIECTQCKYVRTKEEQFYNLSLPIKNLSHLHQCFQKYIEGEIINDFRCDQCNQKVDVNKRQLLSALPNVLILHLQRIVFNLDTLMNEKINSRLEFPMDLDLKDYCIDGNDSTKYTLKGVIVHYGTAEFGHYFSFIKINEDQWLEFNDSKIKEFKLKSLENDCFGGTMDSKNFKDDDMWGWGRFDQENSQNAYILVYEKSEKSNIQFDFKDQNQKESFLERFNYIKDNMNFYDIKPYIPPHLKQKIKQDNQEFLLERTLFEQQLHEHILKLNSNSFNTLVIFTKFAFDLIAHAYDTSLIEQYTNRLQLMVQSDPSIAYQYLSILFYDQPNKAIDLLLICPEIKTRKAFSNLLALTFNMAINHHQLDLCINQEESTDENLFEDSINLNQQMTYRIIMGLKLLFNLLNEQVPKNWMKMDEYFLFWFQFMQGGPQQVKFMMNMQFITFLLDFVLEKSSPLDLYPKKHSMGNPYTAVNYTNIINIVVGLLQNLKITNSTLSETDKQLIYFYRLYDKVLKNNVLQIQPLILEFIKENQFYSEIVCGCLLRGLNNADQDDTKGYLQTIKLVILFQDSLKTLRLEWLLGVPQVQHHTNMRSVNSSSKNILYNFGIYGQQGLDEDIQHFPSPLGWQSTLLDYFIMNKNSKANDNQCLLVLKSLLELAIEDEVVFKYISSLQSTNFLFKHFEDIMDWFLESYIVDTRRDHYQTFPRESEAEAVKVLLQQYKSKLNPDRQDRDYIVGKTTRMSKMRKIIYVVDQRDGTNLVFDESVPDDKEKWKAICKDPLYEKICVLEDQFYETWICDNEPNGQTNTALPSLYVKGAQYFTYSVEKNSMAANFIQPKIYNSMNDDETECEQQDETLPQSQLIKNPRKAECIRKIQIHNYLFKPIQAVITMKGNPSHYLPKSPIQSSIQPNTTAYMFTILKNSINQDFGELEYDVRYKIQAYPDTRKDTHLYLTENTNY